ncbi:mechanosensitive ion channel [bacterium]|nr:mechanosensitive ion channel [candidate division CSSED10-310 bacterium]
MQRNRWVELILIGVLISGIPGRAQETQAVDSPASGTAESTGASLALADNMSEVMLRQANDVRMSLKETAYRLFTPEPLGFSTDTFGQLVHDLLRLPDLIQGLPGWVAQKASVLGGIGSLLVLVFLIGLTYTLTGRKRVLKRLESVLLPLTRHVPSPFEPLLTLLLSLVATLALPVGFWFCFWLIRAFTGLSESWFLFIGQMLTVWAVSAGSLVIIRQVFFHRMLPLPRAYGDTIYRMLRVITLYIALTVTVFYGAEAFRINPEYLAMLRVILTLSIVFASLLLIARKKEILSLLPDLPYRLYDMFRTGLTRLYTPAMIGTFITGVLWSFGYRALCRFIWIKTWAVAAVIVGIGIAYHLLNTVLMTRRSRTTERDEAAHAFYAGVHAVLVFTTTITLMTLVLSLLDLYDPLKRLVSFPIFLAGETPISIWSFIRAGLIIWLFLLVSRVLRGYLDFKVFPALGVEEGLAYSINTFLTYLLIISGSLFAMVTIGLDLRLLMVFAGAVGIGVGLGLQSLASNVISGFALIFGRKIRKGDWIQAGDTMGYVREVSLRVTKVLTRDNIEYLIPNSTLTADTIVNYTLTDPLIRIHVPVGVSYRTDPDQIRQILMDEALACPLIHARRVPEVWFTEYADSAINFSLLVWIDVRKVSRDQVQSVLYFSIFKALTREGIEIPFPQRDIHIRSDITRLPDKEPPVS